VARGFQGARARALALKRGLDAAERALAGGERSGEPLVAAARDAMAELGVTPEYLELVSTATLLPVARVESEALLAVAARVGGVRLIDNAILRA